MENELIRQNKSPEIGQLIKALVKVQAALEPSKKGSVNPYLDSNYSNLRECWDAAKGPLTENGLAVIQTFGGTADQPSVITLLGHESGQWVEGEMRLNPDRKGCQGAGAAGTYGRRYGFCAAIGLYQEDLDGEDTKVKGGDKKADAKEDGDSTTNSSGKKGKKVSASQVKRFHSVKRDFGWTDQAAKALVVNFGYDSTADIEQWEDYPVIIKELQKGMDGKAKADEKGYCIFCNGKPKEKDSGK